MNNHTTLTLALAAIAMILTTGCEGVEAETPYETTQHALRGDDTVSAEYPHWLPAPNAATVQALTAVTVATATELPRSEANSLRWEEENPLSSALVAQPEYESVDPDTIRTEQDWYAPTPLDEPEVRTDEDWYSN